MCLCDLPEDMGEQRNLAKEEFTFTEQLKADADAWRAEIEKFWTDRGHDER